MVFKSIGRIVGSAYSLNAGADDEISRAVLGLCKKLVALLPNARCRLLCKRFVNVEISLELKVSPMVHRIADKARDGSRKCEELLVSVGVAGNVFLFYAVASHLTPLIVVAAEEEVCGILEAVVLCNQLRVEVTVIINYGELLYHFVELLRYVIFQHKAVVDNTHFHAPGIVICFYYIFFTRFCQDRSGISYEDLRVFCVRLILFLNYVYFLRFIFSLILHFWVFCDTIR